MGPQKVGMKLALMFWTLWGQRQMSVLSDRSDRQYDSHQEGTCSSLLWRLSIRG